MFRPHRSRVFNSRVQKNMNLEFFTLDFKQITKNIQTQKKKDFKQKTKNIQTQKKKKKKKNPKKKERKKKERRKPRRKKEKRRRSTTKGMFLLSSVVGIACFCCLGLYWKGSCCFLGFEGLNICWRLVGTGLVLDWSFFFLKSGTFVGLYFVATDWNLNLRDSSSTWIPHGIFMHVSCLKTLELEFLKLDLLLNSSFKNSRC